MFAMLLNVKGGRSNFEKSRKPNPAQTFNLLIALYDSEQPPSQMAYDHSHGRTTPQTGH